MRVKELVMLIVIKVKHGVPVVIFDGIFFVV